MPIHISSGAIVHKKENGVNKFLLMYRKNTNSWHLPKGTQIAGETLEETALREVKEETGVEMEIEKYLGKLESVFKKNNISIEKITNYFLAKFLKQFPEHDSEHDKIVFLDYHTALNHLEHFSIYEKEGEILKMAEQVLRQ